MKRLIFRNYKNKSRSFLRNVNSNGTTLCQHERHIYCEPINAGTCHLNGSQVIHAPRFAMWRLPHSPRLAINLQHYSIHCTLMQCQADHSGYLADTLEGRGGILVAAQVGQCPRDIPQERRLKGEEIRSCDSSRRSCDHTQHHSVSYSAKCTGVLGSTKESRGSIIPLLTT